MASAYRVSVVVPNYNHARFLSARLDSILAQTFSDFELIYLDDASTDDSATVWARYEREARVTHIVVNAQNSGSPFAQWNRGVLLARGEFVWIAEADDVADVRFLERLVTVLDANPNVGVAYSQSNLIDDEGRIWGSAYAYNENMNDAAKRWQTNFVNAGKSEVANFLARHCTIPNASAVVFRRAVYNAVGGADVRYRLGGDHLLWTKMLLQSDVAFVAEPLNEFRRHTGTVRQTAYRDGTNLVEGYQIAAFIREQVSVPRAVWEAACDDLMDRWLEVVLLGHGAHVSRARREEIIRLQKIVDAKPRRRFVRRFAQRTLKKFGGLLRTNKSRAVLPAETV